MNRPYTLELWQNMADFVLAVLIGEGMADHSEQHYWLAQQGNLAAADFPEGQWRETYSAIGALLVDRKPVHITTLAGQLKNDYSGYHAALYTTYGKPGQSTLKGEVFTANVKEVRRLAQIARDLKLYEESMQRLVQGDDRDAVAGSTVTRLVSVSSGEMRGETAHDTGEAFRSWMDAPGGDDFQTGIDQVDSWCNGMMQGVLIVLAAALKQRKTTFLLNLMLNMVRKHRLSVALMMFENTRQMIVAQCISMLAIEYLIQQGLYNEPVALNSPVLHRHISAEQLVKLRGRYRRWPDRRTDAVDYAIDTWWELEKNFRIYDRTPEGGALSDCASIRRVAMRDAMLYGTHFLGIDHAQRINEPGSEYEKLTVIAPFIEQFARAEKTTVCLLAQLNVAGANTAAGEEGYTSGIRGGIILDEANDYLFKTTYRPELPDGTKLPDDRLLLHLKHNRYGRGDLKAVLRIDPFTGLILDNGRGVTLDAYLNLRGGRL